MLVHRHRVLALELMRETYLLTEVFPELRPICDPAENEADFRGWNTLLRTLEFLPEPGFELALAAVLSETPVVTPAVAMEICRRLRLSNDESEQIVWLVTHRSDVAAAPAWGIARLKRLLAEPLIRDLLALTKAAALARGLEPAAVEFCEEYLRTTGPELISPPAIITGNDLIAHGLRPGPRFKRLLDDLRDAQLEGRIATKAEALALADQLQNGLPDAKT